MIICETHNVFGFVCAMECSIECMSRPMVITLYQKQYTEHDFDVKNEKHGWRFGSETNGIFNIMNRYNQFLAVQKLWQIKVLN